MGSSTTLCRLSDMSIKGLASSPESGRMRTVSTFIRRVGEPIVVLVAAAIGLLSSILFGAFATYPYFPSIPGWSEYPEPLALTREKLVENGVIAVVLVAGIAIVLLIVRRFGAGSWVKAPIQLLTFSSASWVVVYAWRLAGRDAIGTEAGVSTLWLAVVLISGLVAVWVGLAVGAVELGIRPAASRLRGQAVAVVPRSHFLSGESWSSWGWSGCGLPPGEPLTGWSCPSSQPSSAPLGSGGPFDRPPPAVPVVTRRIRLPRSTCGRPASRRP